MLTISTMFLLTTLAFVELAARAPIWIEEPDEAFRASAAPKRI